jgi:hypothetical protein
VAHALLRAASAVMPTFGVVAIPFRGACVSERPDGRRGRKLARLAGRNQPIPPSTVIAFEDIVSLLHVLTEKRVLLLKQVKEKPASISDLAKKLKRDRSAVTRDVQILERFGILEVTPAIRALHSLLVGPLGPG